MNFVYLDYGTNFINEIKKRNLTENSIIVFSDYFFKNSYMKTREKNILIPEPTYLTLEEFQKKIFKTDRMILTEAKRPLTLFRVLDDSLKEKLNVESYYDIIDFADLFFNYYKELNISLVEKLSGLQKWQEDFIEKYELLKKKYDVFLEENEFIPSDWVERKENFTDEDIKKFDRIIFADIPYFTPLMRETIKTLSKTREIDILLQIPKKDYNEDLLKVEKVTLTKKKDELSIKVYENPDEMSELLNLIYSIKLKGNKIKKELFSPLPEKNSYHKIFPKYFVSQQLKVLEETLLYKFMKIENNLLVSLEPKKRFGIPCEELKKAINSEIFRKIYDIDEDIFKVFKKIFSEEYKYLDITIFTENELDYLFKDDMEKIHLNRTYKVFENIYNTLKEIERYETVQEFLEHIRSFGLNNFNEESYTDIIEKFYEAIDNIKSSEKLCGKGGFRSFFKTDIGTNLYTLLIKYMEGIEVREVEKNLEPALGIIKNLNEVRLHNSENRKFETYFVDIDNTSLPGAIKDKLNFTESQRIENGLITFEDKKVVLKYRFIQGLFNTERSIIFTKKNVNKEIERSIFLDEIMLEYDISVEEENFLDKDMIFDIIHQNLFSNINLPEIKTGEKYFTLEKSEDDFIDHKLVLGTYDIINLRDCEYRYFMEKIAKLHGEDEETYGTSLRFLGIVVHKIFEKVSEKVYMNIKKDNDFEIDEKYLDTVISRILRENQMKIPTYMDLYFKEVLFPKIKENVFDFYHKIKRELGNKKVKIFWGEKGRTEKIDYLSEKLDVFITGRADLIIETEDDTKYIVDYKTGGKQAEQLDIYSIIMYGDETVAQKIIYNAIKGDFEKMEKIAITKDGLKEAFTNFFDEEKYKRAEKISSCRYCEYKNICKREEM